MNQNIHILFFIYLALLLCAVGIFIQYLETAAGPMGSANWYGGAFDLSSFLETTRNKYSQQLQHKGSAIEVEIKLSRKDLFNKIIEWVRQRDHTETKTTNKIWQHDGLISTTDADGNEKWSRKKRISKYILPVGKLTVALEESDVSVTEPTEEPSVIRKKHRISTQLNEHWQIDCTWVNEEQDPEVEMEYIAKDYWNSPQHIHEIEEFLRKL